MIKYVKQVFTVSFHVFNLFWSTSAMSDQRDTIQKPFFFLFIFIDSTTTVFRIYMQMLYSK